MKNEESDDASWSSSDRTASCGFGAESDEVTERLLGGEEEEDHGPTQEKKQRRRGRSRNEGAGLMLPLQKAASLSSAFLLVAFVVMMCGMAIGVVMVTAKIQGLHKMEQMTWTIAFLPIWIGNATAVLFQLLSLFVFLPRARMIMFEDLDIHMQGIELEKLLPVAKSLCKWNCFDPLVGLLPPLPYLAFLTWFEIWVCIRLEGGLVGLSYYILALPLLLMESIGVIHLVLVHSAGFLTGSFVICTFAWTILIAARLEQQIVASWWIVFIPVWIWFLAVIIVYIYLAINIRGRSRNVMLTKTQSWALFGYFVSLVLGIASMCMICKKLDDVNGSTKVFPTITFLLFGSSMFLIVSAFFIAKQHLERFVKHGITLTKIAGAGLDEKPGIEDWGLLGHVIVVRERTSNLPLTACVQLTAQCSGR